MTFICYVKLGVNPVMSVCSTLKHTPVNVSWVAPTWLFGNLFESLATKWLLDMSIDWQLTFELWHHFRWWSLILFY